MSNGNIIGKINTPTTTKASGVWSIREQVRAQRDSVWPAVSNVILVLTSATETIEWDGLAPLVLDSSESYSVSVNSAASVSVKMWGAGGACGFDYTQNISSTALQGPGGGGGYSAATISLSPANSYTFQVGEGGKRTQTIKDGATYLAGGVRQSILGGAEGGGYTGIFKTSVSQANALLIAGGGGGGSDTRVSSSGGAGGGSAGLPGASNDLQAGKGGTQSAGGAPSVYNNATAGSALTGGLGQNNEATLGGGGGGYFGGGGGNVGGGGGGSGRVSSDPDVSSGSTSAGSGSTPANSSDPARGTAGNGGVAGSTAGSDGKIVLTLV
jgi:hypothetical protein